jgi:DNA-binding NtrC family response regulator
MKHILITDDAPDTRMLFECTFREQLTTSEWRFSFANNGEEAILILQEHSDIVVAVVDLMMPRMDGFDLLRYLQTSYAYIVPIVYSVSDNRENMTKTMRFGAFDYLIKPVNPQILQKSLFHALEHYQHTLAATHHRLRQALELQAATLQTMNNISAAVQESHHYAAIPA